MPKLPIQINEYINKTVFMESGDMSVGKLETSSGYSLITIRVGNTTIKLSNGDKEKSFDEFGNTNTHIDRAMTLAEMLESIAKTNIDLGG